MSRLTEKSDVTGEYLVTKCMGHFCGDICQNSSCSSCPIQEAIDKLAEYEDLEEIFRSKMTGISCDFLKDKEEFAKWLDRNIWTSKKLDEYARAEEQGKLLRLPVAVGDTVYIFERPCNSPFDCGYDCNFCEDFKFYISKTSFVLDMLDDVGNTVFVTREAAEAKLMEMEK